jgi:hypothetical protein
MDQQTTRKIKITTNEKKSLMVVPAVAKRSGMLQATSAVYNRENPEGQTENQVVIASSELFFLTLKPLQN